MNRKFENKIVLVTGGTSGIGKATAIAFVDGGAKVVLPAGDISGKATAPAFAQN